MAGNDAASVDVENSPASRRRDPHFMPEWDLEHFGAAAILNGIYSSSHSRALVHGWLLGSPAVLLCKEHGFVSLQKGALRIPAWWLRSQPMLTASPGQAGISFPRQVAGKWRGLAFCSCLAGRVWCMKKDALNAVFPTTAHPRAACLIQRWVIIDHFSRYAGAGVRSHLGVQPRAIVSSFKQKSLSVPLFSMVETGLTKASLAVPAASCISFTFY